jgi:hypothetical protein
MPRRKPALPPFVTPAGFLAFDPGCTTQAQGVPTWPPGSAEPSLRAITPSYGRGAALITYLGERRYQVGGEFRVVDEVDDFILRAFIGKGALSKKQLGARSGCDPEAAVRALRSLAGTKTRPAKYAGIFSRAITMPGGRGRGGYRVNVVAAS